MEKKIENEALEKVLKALKPFQRKTVDYVFSRYFTDEDKTNRFLVADEVGLGKTLVASGLVAKTVQRLSNKGIEEINIVYISSNSVIALQNTKKLNVFAESSNVSDRRVTLIPVPRSDGTAYLNKNKINLVSLTPGTTFKLRNGIGVMEERAFLFHLLKKHVNSQMHDSLKHLLQGNAGKFSWESKINNFPIEKIDDKIINEFNSTITSIDKNFIKCLKEMCNHLAFTNHERPIDDIKTERNKFISSLRRELANVCIDELKPSLIILDEFHKFSDLLSGDTEESKLLLKLLNYKSIHSNFPAKVLLLSATPYKMQTLPGGQLESNAHYEEFKKVLKFLVGSESGEETVKRISDEFENFRKLLFELPNECVKTKAKILKEKIQFKLKKVIARTERDSNDSSIESLISNYSPEIIMESRDIKEIKAVLDFSEYLQPKLILDFWKSSPYLLNFMQQDYVLKKNLNKIDVPDKKLLKVTKNVVAVMLKEHQINGFKDLKVPNGRMRKLLEDVFASQLVDSLWIPPSMAYYSTKHLNTNSVNTKSLVFSSWKFTPVAISALVSYESERLLQLIKRRKINFSKNFSNKNSQKYSDRPPSAPLQFKYSYSKSEQHSPAGLRAFLLFYPSPTLAKLGDPLEVLSECDDLPTLTIMKRKISSKLKTAKRVLRQRITSKSDQLPDWVMPALIDKFMEPNIVSWLDTEHSGFQLVWKQFKTKNSEIPSHGSSSDENFDVHVKKLLNELTKSDFSKLPSKFNSILVNLALGSPAVCALRTLKRVAPSMDWSDHNLLSESAKIALGFRKMLNQRDSIALIRQKKSNYIDSVLDYCVKHNLQSVLDEYVHYLFGELNLENMDCLNRIKVVSDTIVSVLTTNPSQIEVDRISDSKEDFGSKRFKFNMRGRFAMRLIDRDSESTNSRTDSIRTAFNSPFKPFVLATTSIGQEGLDFHPYCHRLYHWNLPRSPVEYEQREGRVHRYKNHAVRLNLAREYSNVIFGKKLDCNDPWQKMFNEAEIETKKQDKIYGSNKSKLTPFWIFDGKTKIEQYILLLPFSKEIQRYNWLKSSRAVYRLTFGQQRQLELLNYLNTLKVDNKLTENDILDLQISLEPNEVAQ